MDGHIVTTEVGYSVYIGSIEIANVGSIDEAIDAIKTTNLPWNGVITRSMSTYMPCQ